MAMRDRLKTLLTDLMLIPGLSGYEGRVRAYLKKEMMKLGLATSTDGLGNLTITDIDGTGRNNQLTIQRVGNDLVVTDLFETFVAAPAGGTLSVDGHTITISLASLTGGVFINLEGGSDVLTVDYTGGLLTQADLTSLNVHYDGGSGTNSIVLVDGSGVVMNSMASYLLDGTSGQIEAAKSGLGAAMVTYTDVASITDNVVANNRVLWFSNSSETITPTLELMTSP